MLSDVHQRLLIVVQNLSRQKDFLGNLLGLPNLG